MRNMVHVAAAAMLAVGGVAAAGHAVRAGAAYQADPFDTARYYIGVKQTAQALAIVDSGQFDVNQQTEEGYTLLHYAAEAGDMAMVKALLARGADPNIKSRSPALTPYQMAYSTLIKAELRKAMAAGAKPVGGAPATAPAGGANGMCEMARNEPASSSRPLSMRPLLKAKDAIWYNHPDELVGLIEDCVGVNQQDQYGYTLLHHAADRDRVALARLLLERGASRTVRNKDGQTAAQLATSPEMKALLGSAAAAKPAPANGRDAECQQKYRADAALCSDSTCKMGAMRKWQQCLKTGRYW